MRRKTKRAFRYFFPAIMFAACTFLFKEGSSKNVTKDMPQEVTENIVASKNTSAKMLRLISHNPETKAKLLINAQQAVQDGDELILNNPNGVFENTKGLASLKSTTASYCEADKKVLFFKKVSFDHYSGLAATTNHAVLNTQTQGISGNQGIEARHQKNTITAESYEIEPNNDTVNFTGKVCLNIKQGNY